MWMARRPLMRQDATFCMSPYSLWLQEPREVRTWMLGLGCGCRGSFLDAKNLFPCFGFPLTLPAWFPHRTDHLPTLGGVSS